LLGAVDDATGEAVAAVFRDQEDSAGYLLLLRQVVTSRGIPAAVYRDRHSIFRAPGTERLSVEDQLLNTADVLPTQVGRVLAELVIHSIAAASPQAKGRIERSWRTHQDRLVAELRLAGVTSLEQANAFLPSYLERYRARFAVPPASSESAYVPLSPGLDLDRLFCCKYTPVGWPATTPSASPARCCSCYSGVIDSALPGRWSRSTSAWTAAWRWSTRAPCCCTSQHQQMLHRSAPRPAASLPNLLSRQHRRLLLLSSGVSAASHPSTTPGSSRTNACAHSNGHSRGSLSRTSSRIVYRAVVSVSEPGAG